MAALRSGRASPTLLAGAAVVLLAVGALVWPRGTGTEASGRLLVLDPSAGPRLRQVYQPLAKYCADLLGSSLEVVVVPSRGAFIAAASSAQVLLCPDAVALQLASAAFEPVAVGRRRVPLNLRPCSVLVSRRAAGLTQRPWLTAASRTVFGDSLSLVCLAPLCDEGEDRRLPQDVAFGSDPYDHGAVLEAACLGAFDYAVVRQWAAEAWQEAGRLPPSQWDLRHLSEPMPDIVVMASRAIPASGRLALREGLVTLGRHPGGESTLAQVARAALVGMDLDGFNLLLEPDFDGIRRRYASCWPRTGE